MNETDNQVGIEANIAFIGLGLIIYSIFNYVFITNLYKSSYKIGKPFIISITFTLISIFLMETVSHLPFLSWIDGTSISDLKLQIPVFVIGFILFVIINLLAYKNSIKNFNKVDL